MHLDFLRLLQTLYLILTHPSFQRHRQALQESHKNVDILQMLKIDVKFRNCCINVDFIIILNKEVTNLFMTND